MTNRRHLIVAGLALAIGLPAHGWAEDLYVPGRNQSLASDRVARKPGDSLTLLVFENATASNRVTGAASRKSRGAAEARNSVNDSSRLVELGVTGSFDGRGETQRAGRMVAQVSVTVQDVLPNGDLRVAGTQRLRISGEDTVIKIAGRLRPADISAENTAPSSRLSDAEIEYGGSGFVNDRGRPGPVQYILALFGIL